MRKVPQQERSRRLVAQMIDATGQLLMESGYDSVTTNRVAELAGVSPGSLYQYFSDKDSLIDALVETRSVALGEKMSRLLIDRLARSGPELVREVFDLLIDVLTSDAALVRVIFEELPARNHRERREGFERRIADILAAYLAGRGLIGPDRDLRTVSWILTTTLGSLAVRYVLDRPDLERDTFIDEVVRLCWNHLDTNEPKTR